MFSKPILFILLIFVSIINIEAQNSTFLKFVKECKHNIKESNITLNLRKQDSCYLGLKLPELSAKTIYNEKITPDYYKNKVIILNIWSVWCGPCIAELPGLNEITEMYQNKDVVFIALSNEKKESILKFINSGHPFSFKIIPDAKHIFYNQLDSFGFPRTIIADKNGIIRKVFSGGVNSKEAPKLIKDEIVPTLEKLLKN